MLWILESFEYNFEFCWFLFAKCFDLIMMSVIISSWLQTRPVITRFLLLCECLYGNLDVVFSSCRAMSMLCKCGHLLCELWSCVVICLKPNYQEVICFVLKQIVLWLSCGNSMCGHLSWYEPTDQKKQNITGSTFSIKLLQSNRMLHTS